VSKIDSAIGAHTFKCVSSVDPTIMMSGRVTRDRENINEVFSYSVKWCELMLEGNRRALLCVSHLEYGIQT
jgi:hypothetical protein